MASSTCSGTFVESTCLCVGNRAGDAGVTTQAVLIEFAYACLAPTFARCCWYVHQLRRHPPREGTQAPGWHPRHPRHATERHPRHAKARHPRREKAPTQHQRRKLQNKTQRAHSPASCFCRPGNCEERLENPEGQSGAVELVRATNHFASRQEEGTLVDLKLGSSFQHRHVQVTSAV